MKIRYHCHYGRLTGYGRAARDYLLALHRAGGVELSINPIGDAANESPEPRYRELDQFVDRSIDADVHIVHGPPGELAKLGPQAHVAISAPIVAMTTWEVANDDTAYVARNIAPYFEGIIVPSRFCERAIRGPIYSRALVERGRKTTEISVVPHCFDPSFWPRERPSAPDRIYRFYSIGAPSDRKNLLGAVKAYLSRFAGVSDVMLSLYGGPDRVNVKELVAASNLPSHEVPHIEITPASEGPMSEEQLVMTHKAGDCFVSTTRGEGWGLGAFEAAIMGRHVVMPGYGGQTEFLDDYPHWAHVDHMLTPVVPASRKEIDPESGGVRSVADAPRCLDARSLWAEPDLEEVGEAMWHAYKDRDTGCMEHRAELERRFSYEAVAPKLLRALEGHLTQERSSA